MSADPQPLPCELADALAEARPRLGRLGGRILFFPAIHSTNNVASTLAAAGGNEGAIVVADTQTAGRGRRGRSWFSPPGAGLYVSIVLEPGRTAGARDRAVALLTLAAGVALAEAVERATGLQPTIKWPNDLIVGGRKAAGILAEGILGPSAGGETQQIAAAVLGYGVNVAPSSFPAEISDRATSLETELGRTVDRASLFAESIAAMAQRYDDLLSGRFDAILDAWHARAPVSRGTEVQWETPSGTRTGTTAGADDMGALLVRTGNGIERLVAGEVIWANPCF
jgi:BirA family biotin operon repressor/biotin-[acetyl-CoA-carboxylase] ligase